MISRVQLPSLRRRVVALGHRGLGAVSAISNPPYCGGSSETSSQVSRRHLCFAHGSKADIRNTTLLLRSHCVFELNRQFHSGSVLLEDEKKEEAAPPPPKDTPDDGPGPSPEYSTPEITEDAAKHKAGLYDETRPMFQNPLHHNNPDKEKMFAEDFESEEEFEKAKALEVNKMPAMDKGDGKFPAPKYIHELADEVLNLTMLEMNELINKLDDHYGFTDGMLEPEGGADGEGGDDDDDEEGGAAEEKTAFDVKLMSFDAKAKIKVIKEVRAIAGLGLKEAKEMVESAPTIIQKDLNKEQAEETKAKLAELGAEVEIL
eukprot:CAMPEP_0172444926 /NCGR_PEP_ID=MMETSP1065-20121228/4937_1 /TAXON_ID=265537 /ORGANISM="Amphiprora paludosa, Strain CCMP125" /LENGTH=316 /DNA_ID=CAMNT_0013195689 /DNA_START=13 /DNA_END=963 /DNA_ORIENTATION=-